ncbi:MAG: DUF2959 family protein [Planctomycetes bacterium]|nr:DUF2959 family protein [Planctomycetota bacterium]
MKRISLHAAGAAALALSFLTSCQMFGSGDTGPGKVNDLVGWIERVYVDSELARQEVRSALGQLQAIVGKEFTGDPVPAFQSFVEAIKRSEDQAKKLTSAVGPMKRTADPVFKRWATDLESFHSVELRQRSQERLLDTRRRYDAIVTAVDPMQVSLEKFNKSLRDHSLFLGHDFNAGSVAAIRNDVQTLSLLAKDLDAQLEASMRAAKAYVDSAALPVSASPGGTPGR